MKMNSLSNLLAHEIVDLYSAEEQIIEALPLMIEKTQNQDLKKALKEHLKITEQQKKRLEKVFKQLEKEDGSSEESLGDSECLGMKGLIEEGQKIMSEEMEPDVMDAAIIAAAQKIEHYEISSYGTACAYARELELKEIEKQLQQTLDEEYTADDLLTELAVGYVNEESGTEGGEEEEINVRKLPASSKSGAGNRSASRSKSSSGSRGTSNGSSKKSSSRSSGRTKKNASSKGGGGKSTNSRSKSSSGGGRSGNRSGSKSSRGGR